jgi:K(+)-stimulated pyrophosphate-energized sodium pump
VNGKAKATVTTSKDGNVNVQVFEGSLEDVKAKVEALK